MTMLNLGFKGLTAKLINCNYHPLDAVPRDPQLQVGENYSDFGKMNVDNFCNVNILGIKIVGSILLQCWAYVVDDGPALNLLWVNLSCNHYMT